MAVLKALEALYHLRAREILMGGTSPEQYHSGTGFLRAIETMATLPESLATVITRVETDAARQRTDDSTSEQRNFYGTPYWDASRADAEGGAMARANGRPKGVGPG